MPRIAPHRREAGKSLPTHSAGELAGFLKARLVGDGSVRVSAIASLQQARPGDLIFLEDEKFLPQALRSAASVVIAGEFALGNAGSKTLLICAHPRLAFAQSAALLCGNPPKKSTIHRSAIIHPQARLGKGVSIGERVIIGRNSVVGRNTRIGAGSVVGEDARIGNDCELFPNVTLYPGVSIGDRVLLHAGAVLGGDGFGYVRDPATGRYQKFPQVGRLEIGDDVEIGANTTIDRGALDVTRIGRGTKIDNLVHIGHNCQIGEDVVIAAQTGLSGSVTIERNAVLAGQVGIADHVCIKEGVTIGAQGGVPTAKILRGSGEVYWGTPARPIRKYLKQLAVLNRLARKD